jgi:hypothetical protein
MADIDYTYLQKRGIIKKKEEKKLPYKITKDGMVDLTSHVSEAVSSEFKDSSYSQQQTGMASNPFGFLDSVSQSQGSASASPSSGENSSAELNALKIKIDDLEYKLQRLIERLEQLESRR